MTQTPLKSKTDKLIDGLTLKPEHISIHALNAFSQHNPSSRAIMMGGNLSQCLTINGTESRIQTGAEQDLGVYTMSIQTEANLRVLYKIPRYRNVSATPAATTIIYEDVDTFEVGCIEIASYGSLHQYYGFDYVPTEDAARLIPGSVIPKDTILYDSVAKKDGSYNYGVELNMAYMTHPSVAEDGVWISQSTREKCSYNVYDKRVINIGSDQFLLNLYGDDKNYKPLPDIGEDIRIDGMVAALREHNTHMSPVYMSAPALMKVDPFMDEAIYTRAGKSTVIDIKVYHNEFTPNRLYTGMDKQITKYEVALIEYHREILNAIKDIASKNKVRFGVKEVQYSHDLQNLIVKSMVMVDGDHTHRNAKGISKIRKYYKGDAIDTYRIEITLKHRVAPTMGGKLTDKHGGKGVIVRVSPDDEMPIDSSGVRADIVMDSGGTVSRMNLGRVYEQYVGGACTRTSTQIRQMMEDAPQEVNTAYDHMLGFMKLTTVDQYKYYNDITDPVQRQDIIADVVNRGIYLYMPIGQDINSIDMVTSLEASPYKPTYGPVTFTGLDGELVTTNNPVRIGPIYTLMLDKSPDVWMSSPSPKTNHFHIPTPVTIFDKFRLPWRLSPCRVLGESETRIFLSYAGREVMAELMDRSSSTRTHKELYRKILTSPYPGNIEQAIDRKKIPLGTTHPLIILNHLLACGGIKLKYVDKRPK